MQIRRKEEEEEKNRKIGEESKRRNIEKGMQLGKYELGRTLGEGNFGKVKLAKDVGSGQLFAVKILEKNKIIDLKITDQVSFLPFSLFLPPFLLLRWVLNEIGHGYWVMNFFLCNMLYFICLMGGLRFCCKIKGSYFSFSLTTSCSFATLVFCLSHRIPF